MNTSMNKHLIYHKVPSSNTSHLEAHTGFFRLLMKGIFYPYVLWSFDKKLISWLVIHIRTGDKVRDSKFTRKNYIVLRLPRFHFKKVLWIWYHRLPVIKEELVVKKVQCKFWWIRKMKRSTTTMLFPIVLQRTCRLIHRTETAV